MVLEMDTLLEQPTDSIFMANSVLKLETVTKHSYPLPNYMLSSELTISCYSPL